MDKLKGFVPVIKIVGTGLFYVVAVLVALGLVVAVLLVQTKFGMIHGAPPRLGRLPSP